MKKLLFGLIISILVVQRVRSQGIYFKANAGYGLPVAPSVIGQKISQIQDQTGNNNTIVTTSKNTTASFSSGVSGELGIGFMFNKYLGVELNVKYISSKKFETSEVYTYKSDNTTGSQNTVNKTFSRSILLNPAFVVNPGPKLPYARFGFILGSPTIKEESSYFDDLDGGQKKIAANGGDSRSTKGEYKTNMALGFQGALGMKWTLGNNFDLFAEASLISMTAYTKSYKLTEYINNGQDQLASIQTYYKEINYNKTLTVDNLQSVNYDKPQEALRQDRSCSSVALQVGVIYSLNKKVLE